MSKWKSQLALTKEELGVLLLAMNSIDPDDEKEYMKKGVCICKLYHKIYEHWDELDEEYYDQNSQARLTR